MTKDDLYNLLELDSPADFEYFEQLADLIECEDNIPFELILELLSDVSKETLAELTENYLKEFSDAIPRENEELTELTENITQRMQLLTEALEDEQSLREFAEELDKFRTWYHREGGATVDGEPMSIMDAVAEHRAEQLGGRKHDYDFPGVLDYELRELTLPLGRFEKIGVVSDEGEEN